MAGGHRESYVAPHSLRGGARQQEICFGGAPRVMMRTLRYRRSEMTFGSRSKFAEVTASFSPPPSRDLGIAAPPGLGALQAMGAGLRQITNPARLIQVRQSHATVLIHARKDSITADRGLWCIHTT